MLRWRFTKHITYVVLEVKHVVLDAYYTQNTLSKYVVCQSLLTMVMLVVHTHKGISS